MGDVYQYTDSDSNLDASYNWYDETETNPGTVPGVNDIAIINYGTLLTGTLNVSTLIMEQGSGAPALSLTGASTQVIGEVVAVAGALTVENGADLEVDTLELLGGGTVLSIVNGGNLTGNSGDGGIVTIGTTSGISELAVSGLTSNIEISSTTGTLAIGAASSSVATLSITGGGAFSGTYADAEISDADGATGSVIVSGAGSVLELTGLTEIGGYGTGALTVSAGAYASLGGGQFVVVGGSEDGNASSGTITVTGQNSLISTDGTLIVGEAGYSTGRLIVQAGGTLTNVDSSYIENGALSVAGAGSVFMGQLLQIDTTTGGLSVGAGGKVEIVTMHLDSGKATLTGGEIDIRRSDYISSGASISGYGTVNGAVNYNSGLLNAAGGTLRFIGAVNDTGTAQIQAGATLEFDGGVAATQTVSFQSATGTLGLADGKDFAGLIANMVQGDTIDLLGQAATAIVFKAGHLKVENGSSLVANLAFKGAHTQANFHLASDGHGGSDITFVASPQAQPVEQIGRAGDIGVLHLHSV